MADERDQPTITDWVVTAITPVLIMLMVGSLTFFLVEVLYAGKYTSRLLYTLFFFVAGAVLIARISIERGYSTAGIYGLGLGIVTLIALQAFVEYPTAALRTFGTFINIGLMALVWWSANKLTWDCTHLDEARKASGRGVLAAAGLDETAAAANPVQQEEDEAAADGDAKAAKKRKKDPPGFAGWLARWNRYREAQKKKPHTPGVWVIYFSLAALPLFGLGQSLIDPADADRRRATFMDMVVYVGSGLGLLVTTSLLGLRKYLRERGATTPAAMTVGWLGLGAGLILVFLAVGAVLPRPHSETPWFGMQRAGTKERGASRYAQVKGDSTGKGDGAAGNKTESGKDAKASGKSKEKGGNAGEKGGGGGKGNDQGGKQSGGEKGGQKGDDKGGKGDEEKSGRKGDDRKQDGPNRKTDPKGNDKGGEKQADGKDAGDDSQENQDADGQGGKDSSSDNSPSKLGQMLESVSSGLKWLVWVIVAVLVVVGLVVFFLKFLAPFTDWARNLLDWLKGLFARKPKAGSAAGGEDAAAEEIVRRPPPFADFPNPFRDGSARRMTVEQLTAYTFAAFDAWAWDRDRGRTPGETPNEFAARVGEEFPALEEASWRLANLYARVLYSPTGPPADAMGVLKGFWEQIEQPVYAET